MGDINESERKPTGAPDHDKLFGIASEQAGYFTALQAKVAGISQALLSHHVKGGRFMRIRRGLYRLRDYPSTSRENVMIAWLEIGKNTAVVSHESALDLLGLSDIIPNAVHLTVPRSRRNLPKLSGVKIHTSVRGIPIEDRPVRGGIVVTSATRSIIDSADVGMEPEQVRQAVKEAISRGLATPHQLELAAMSRGKRLETLIQEAVRQVSTR